MAVVVDKSDRFARKNCFVDKWVLQEKTDFIDFPRDGVRR